MRAPRCAPAADMSPKMPNKMLIDATHPEETRVVVVRGNRVAEFDFETAQRKQLRGNIYLAKVTRVDPAQAAQPHEDHGHEPIEGDHAHETEHHHADAEHHDHDGHEHSHEHDHA